MVWGIRSRTSLLSALHGRLYAPPSTAANLPCLPGSSHPEGGVLTSFVPPIHNQGVSLAPLQGHALWKIFLPTTGSFFVISLTDLSGMPPVPAPCGGRLPEHLPCLPAACHGWIRFLNHRLRHPIQPWQCVLLCFSRPAIPLFPISETAASYSTYRRRFRPL